MAAVRSASDPTLLARKVWLSATLCATGKNAEGERLAREVLTTIAPSDTSGVKVAQKTIDACQAREPSPNRVRGSVFTRFGAHSYRSASTGSTVAARRAGM